MLAEKNYNEIMEKLHKLISQVKDLKKKADAYDQLMANLNKVYAHIDNLSQYGNSTAQAVVQIIMKGVEDV